MLQRGGTDAICITCLFVLCILNLQYYGSCTQDQTSQRANTLRDDADDIQRQLDNEARDRVKYGRAKTIWVLRFPTRLPQIGYSRTRKFIPSRVKKTEPEAEDQCEPPPKPKPQPKAEAKSESKPEIKVKPTPEIKPKPECEPEPKTDEVEPPKQDFNPELQTPPPKPDDSWDYRTQNGWRSKYPKCGGSHQSPMALPAKGLKLLQTGVLTFCNFHIQPSSMTLTVDSHRIVLYGDWPGNRRPTLFGGVLATRRYVFDSLVFHWPSEHIVGEKRYPLETQAYFVSTDYGGMAEALAAPGDRQAVLAVASLYNFASSSQPALEPIIEEALYMGTSNETVQPEPLVSFIPVFTDYASYQGSLPVPPCAEVVLWIVPARTLPVTKRAVEIARTHVCVNGIASSLLRRIPQNMNDRKVYYCKSEVQISQSLFKEDT